jgi:hypothetical protein
MSSPYPSALAATLDEDTELVSVMAANNETGALQPIAELAIGDYEGLATDGRSAVRPLFVETNANAPQDSTDAYSGLFPAGRHNGPFAEATATAPARTAGTLGARPHRLVR